MAAEILASMYDASLDQFINHAWEKPSIHDMYPTRDGTYSYTNWTAANCFRAQVSENRYYPDSPVKGYEKGMMR